MDKQLSVQELLAEQLAAAQRVLTINYELTSRLKKDPSDEFRAGLRVRAESNEAPTKTVAAPVIMVGEHVQVEGFGPGVVRFVGVHHIVGDARLGIELDGPAGKHDGEVQGHRYFTCEPNCGILVEPNEATPLGFVRQASQNVRSSRFITPEPVADNPKTGGLQEPLLPPPAPKQVKVKPEADCEVDSGAAPHTKQHRQGLFPDADAVKERVREALFKPTYSVEDLYHKSGMWQELARNEIFKNTTFFVILLNAIWIAIDTDYNKADVLCEAPAVFQVVENAFCFYFSFEILVRAMSFKRKFDSLTDGWFMFDAILVVIDDLGDMDPGPSVQNHRRVGNAASGLGNSTVLRIFRLFRLTRVARLARLLHSMPELMYLVKGMMMAVRSVFSTLFLMIVVIYVFAILFTQLLSHDPAGKDCFENVPQAMNCLLIDGVFTDQGDAINKMLEAGPVYYVFMLLYLLIGSCTVMNMLIGVLCEVVGVVAQVEKEQVLVETTKEKLFSMLPQLDADGDCKVSKDEFLSLLESPDAVLGLSEVDVDVEALVDYTDYIFEGADELGFTAFMETVFQFRGSNNATVKDLVDIRKFLTKEL
eukprot:CAMPEP_0117617426 /NCGR_PEP_ID=MMETSP0784-20121206/85586_1 /TAXON_ID=39447 /ORGANISM="" /LENGTH=590 /DNA_ID=CAMNT_0005421267 /DNA_START=84 /DNA_END=1852 /DNA_ORIENTATION=-